MRQKIGIVFLLLTIASFSVAINQGGLWWAAVAITTALALWGIGFTSSGKEKKSK